MILLWDGEKKNRRGRKKTASHRHHQIGSKSSPAKEKKKKKRPSSLLEGESASWSCFLTTALLSKTKILSFFPPFFSSNLSVCHPQEPLPKTHTETNPQQIDSIFKYSGLYFFWREWVEKKEFLSKSYLWPGLYWIARELFSIALALS